MCFNAALTAKQRELAECCSVDMNSVPHFPDYWNISGFEHPDLPLFCSDKSDQIVSGKWGLIPLWASAEDKAKDIRNKTLNARAETIFTLPSFREAAWRQRCIVLVDGFFEPHKHGGQSIPFFLKRGNGGIIQLAGLFSDWREPGTRRILRTFSIVTAPAKGLLELVHNEKKRMPVMFSREEAGNWLTISAPDDAKEFLLSREPLQDLMAWPVGERKNIPEAQKKVVPKHLMGEAFWDREII